jgi:hypothetical protein
MSNFYTIIIIDIEIADAVRIKQIGVIKLRKNSICSSSVPIVATTAPKPVAVVLTTYLAISSNCKVSFSQLN